MEAIDLNQLNQAKAQTKDLDLKARIEAKAKRAADEESLKALIATRTKALQDEYQAKAALAKANGQPVPSDKALKKSLAELKSFQKKQEKLIKAGYRSSIHHRSFASFVDAYWSRPPRWIANVIMAACFIAFFIYAGVSTGFFARWDTGNPQTIQMFFKGFFVPDYNMFFATGGEWTDFTQSVFFLCLQTFAIAFLGTLFASLLSVPFGFLASKKLFGKWSYVSTVLLIIIRTIPEILFCYILISGTGFGAITGVIVLSIQSIGMIGKMYSDDLDSMDMKFMEALDSSGATTMTKIRLGVFPQVLPNFISTILYRFDLNLRTASILGLVGAGDLGRLILTFSNGSKWAPLGSLIWGLLVMIILVDLVSTYLRKKLV